MDISVNAEGLDDFLKDFESQMRELFDEVGQEAVDYAKQHGNYQNRTGHLRSSNKYKVESDGLTIYNDAEYASDVEARGYDVISGAALYAEQSLKRKVEK